MGTNLTMRASLRRCVGARAVPARRRAASASASARRRLSTDFAAASASSGPFEPPFPEYPANPYRFDGLSERDLARAKARPHGTAIGVAAGTAMGLAQWSVLGPATGAFDLFRDQPLSAALVGVPGAALGWYLGKVYFAAKPVRFINFDRQMLQQPLYEAFASIPPSAYARLLRIEGRVSSDDVAPVAGAVVVEVAAAHKRLVDGMAGEPYSRLCSFVAWHNLKKYGQDAQMTALVKTAVLEVQSRSTDAKDPLVMPATMCVLVENAINQRIEPRIAVYGSLVLLLVASVVGFASRLLYSMPQPAAEDPDAPAAGGGPEGAAK